MDDLIALLKHGGPIAIAVLSIAALKVVWGKLQALRKFYEGDPGDEKAPETSGRLREEREAAQGREDAVRSDYDGRLTAQRQHYESQLSDQAIAYTAQIKDEREENKALYRELVQEIKALGGEE